MSCRAFEISIQRLSSFNKRTKHFREATKMVCNDTKVINGTIPMFSKSTHLFPSIYSSISCAVSPYIYQMILDLMNKS